jgi:hypothetical protein
MEKRIATAIPHANKTTPPDLDKAQKKGGRSTPKNYSQREFDII